MEKLDSFLQNTKNFNKCQRNWNYDKIIDQTIIEKLLDIGYSTPTKQSLQNFTLIAITNRDIIKHLEKASVSYDDWGENHKKRVEAGQVQNPQVNANVLFVYIGNEKVRENKNSVGIEVGISAGALGLAANEIGLRTGLCRCMDKELIDPNLFDSYNLHVNNIILFLGVGFPLHTKDFIKLPKHVVHNNIDFYSRSYPKQPHTRIII
tara:strand:+ start:4600 stop:5220 length:621 start_codon:yes stop_codon:yes gene_type:complete